MTGGFEATENFQNIGRRHPVEKLGLEQPDHPFPVVLVGGVGINIKNDVTRRLIPGQNGIQPEAVKTHHAHLTHGFRGTTAGLSMLQRMPRRGITGTYRMAFTLFIRELYPATEQINRGVILVTQRKKDII